MTLREQLPRIGVEKENGWVMLPGGFRSGRPNYQALFRKPYGSQVDIAQALLGITGINAIYNLMDKREDKWRKENPNPYDPEIEPQAELDFMINSIKRFEETSEFQKLVSEIREMLMTESIYGGPGRIKAIPNEFCRVEPGDGGFRILNPETQDASGQPVHLSRQISHPWKEVMEVAPQYGFKVPTEYKEAMGTQEPVTSLRDRPLKKSGFTPEEESIIKKQYSACIELGLKLADMKKKKENAVTRNNILKDNDKFMTNLGIYDAFGSEEKKILHSAIPDKYKNRGGNPNQPMADTPQK